MGLNLKRDMRQNVPIDFTPEEMSYYMEHFRQIDVENKGFLTLNDIKRHLQVELFHIERELLRRYCFKRSKSEISEEEFRILIREIDQNQNGIIETEEFLQVRNIFNVILSSLKVRF